MHRSTLKLGLAFALAFLASPLRAQAPDSASIRQLLMQRLDESKAGLGIAVGVLDKAGPRFVSYGRMGQAMDGDTLFEIGSISKVFTALLLQDMVDRGVLRLEDPISMHLPGTVKTPEKDGQPITLLHLATHTSGLPRLPENLTPADANNPYADYSVQQMYDFLSGYSLPRKPGSLYEYSNLGAGLLGHILALESGKDYEALLIERICDPLGMRDTRIQLTPEQRSRLAQGHDAEGRPAANWDIPTLAGAGAIRSTVNDLLRLLASGLGSAETPLSRLMAETQAERHAIPGSELAIGLGWHLLKSHGGTIVWHNGGTGGYHSFLGYDRERGVGVVVLSNSVNDIDDLGRHLINPAFELAGQAREAVAVDPKLYDAYAGHYELAPGFVIGVSRQADKLIVQATGQDPFEAFPESETKFFLKVVDAQITFVRDEQGQVAHLILHQNGMDQKARRLGPDYQPPPERKTVEVPPEILGAYVGQYQLAPGVVFDITLDGEHLMAQLTGQPRFRVYAESETIFFYKVVEASLTFRKDASGKVLGLTLHQGGVDQEATRLP